MEVVTSSRNGSDNCYAAAFLLFCQSKSYPVWHIATTGDGQYSLYNEALRTPLRKTTASNSLQGLIVSNQVDDWSNAALWKFAQNNTDLWLQCQDGGLWLGNGGTGTDILLSLRPVGNKENEKAWQLVSVAVTDLGLLTNLPRFVLVNLASQQVYSDSGLEQYVQDASNQRFRRYKLGDLSVFINDATATLIRSNGTLAPIVNTFDPAVWWTMDVNGNAAPIVKSANPTIYFKAVSNTGDLMPKAKSIRLLFSQGMALSVGPGGPFAEPFDRFSPSQAWTYHDWEQGRYLKHVESSTVLAHYEGRDNPVVLDWNYFPASLWSIDFTNADFLNPMAPFMGFPLRAATSRLALSFDNQLNTKLTNGNPCVRLIADSSVETFTTRASVLTTFIKSHGPIFCYHSRLIQRAGSIQPAPLPLSVESFWDRSNPHKPRDGTQLTYQGSSPATEDAIAYILVRDSPDSAYVNYTDFSYYVLSAPGWICFILRYNNETKNLEAVGYSGAINSEAQQPIWVPNLDSNFSTLSNMTNPLEILVRPSDSTSRLHIHLSSYGTVSTSFGNIADSDIVNDAQWEKVVDGGQGTIVEAAMIRDDENGSGIVPPAWAMWDTVTWGTSNTRFPSVRNAENLMDVQLRQ